MNDTARGSSGSRNLALIRAVVVGQMVVCSMLIVGALLFARSLSNLMSSDHGFERDGLLVVGPPTTSKSQSHEDIRTLTRETLLRLNGLGVLQSASCSALVPLSGRQWWDPASVPGYMPSRDEDTIVYVNAISPRYFETWGTKVIAGRVFDESDTAGRQRVAVVNESFAKHYFGGDALGRTFSVGTREEGTLEEQVENLRIVGIVANTKYHNPREATKDLVYIAWDQSTWINPPSIEARVAPGVSVESAVEEVRQVADEVFKIPVDVKPYTNLFETSLERDRLVATLSGLFGLVGVILSIIGVYGVMAYAVATRTSEIGVRLTLGARRSVVLWMIVRESLVLAAVGVAIGIPVALVATRPLRSLLFGLAPSDPVALAATTLCLIVTASLGALVPAMRATTVDPVVCLRTE
jgi:predicted permease